MKLSLAVLFVCGATFLFTSQNLRTEKKATGEKLKEDPAVTSPSLSPRGLNSGYAPSGNFVISRDRLGNGTVRELAPGVSPLKSIGGSGGSLPPEKSAAQKATPRLKGTALDQPAR